MHTLTAAGNLLHKLTRHHMSSSLSMEKCFTRACTYTCNCARTCMYTIHWLMQMQKSWYICVNLCV